MLAVDSHTAAVAVRRATHRAARPWQREDAACERTTPRVPPGVSVLGDAPQEEPGARGASAGGSGGGARQLCAAALVRLVADLWLAAGPAAAFPLALLLLRRRAPTASRPENTYLITAEKVDQAVHAGKIEYIDLLITLPAMPWYISSVRRARRPRSRARRWQAAGTRRRSADEGPSELEERSAQEACGCMRDAGALLAARPAAQVAPGAAQGAGERGAGRPRARVRPGVQPGRARRAALPAAAVAGRAGRGRRARRGAARPRGRSGRRGGGGGGGGGGDGALPRVAAPAAGRAAAAPDAGAAACRRASGATASLWPGKQCRGAYCTSERGWVQAWPAAAPQQDSHSCLRIGRIPPVSSPTNLSPCVQCTLLLAM